MSAFKARKEPVIEIDTKFLVPEVEARVKNMLARLKDSSGHFPSVVGQVSESKVELMRSQRSGNSAFRPQLTASIIPRDAGTRLVVQFGLSKKARAFVRSWCSGVGVWLVLSIVSAATSRLAILWYMPIGGLAVLILGVLLLRVARSYYKDDQDWLLRAISEELRGVVRQDAPDRPQSA